MNRTAEQNPDASIEQLRELLAEHQRISAWLARLDHLTIEVPLEAAAFVRNEYLARLESVAAAVDDRATELRDAAAAAVKRISDARGRIPVLRLRHAVGELDDTALTQHLALLQREAADAEAERGRLVGTIAEIESVLAPANGPTQPPAPPEAVTARNEAVIDDAFGEWQGPPDKEPSQNGTAPSAEPAGEEHATPGADDDLTFLNSLPRSQPPAPTRVPAESPHPVRPAARSGRPAGGSAGALSCRTCGSVNDARSWYCDRCGSELG